MGNCITLKTNIRIRSIDYASNNADPILKNHTRIPKISQSNLLRILDYLKFQELKEVGKVNQ